MNFSEKGAGGGGSKAVRKFSENSSVLAETGFPNLTMWGNFDQIKLFEQCLSNNVLVIMSFEHLKNISIIIDSQIG